MTRKLIIRTVVPLVAAASIFLGAALEAGSLRSTITVMPAETFPGLPVVMELRVENKGWFSTTIPDLLAAWSRSVDVAYEMPDGGTHSLGNPFMCGTGYDGPQPRRIGPGEVVRRTDWISYSHRTPRHVFERPGLYRIRSRFLLPSHQPSAFWTRWFGGFGFGSGQDWVETPSVEVRVRLPEGRAAEAAALFAGDVGDIEYWHKISDFRGKDRSEVLERLGRCADEYTDTPYGKYALYLLGQDATSQGHDATRRKLQEEAERYYRQALEYYLRLYEVGPPANLRDIVPMEIAWRYQALGEFAKARQWVSRLEGLDLPDPWDRSRDRLARQLAETEG